MKCAGNLRQAKKRKDVRLYYGTFNADRTAYKDLVPLWEAAGIKVIHVYSDEGQGYVQDAFAKVGPWGQEHLHVS